VRRLGLITLVALVVVAIGVPAGAITYGEPDGTDHPYVGALIADWDDENPGVEQLCSGTLIDEDVFLTAAHCTAFLESLDIPNDEVWVSFAPDVDPLPHKGQLIQGTWYTNPNYNQRQSDPGDLAIVLLRKNGGATPAQLPAVGLLGQMNAAGTLEDTLFTAVGYGVHEPERGGGPPTFPYDGMRWKSVSTFSSLTSAWLKLSQNDNTSRGGTCFGDSGGPNFLGADESETNIIAALTVTGDAMCLATNTTYRLDTSAAHAFIDPFLD
jgi:V8-like Glu-specific endopeptidase